MHPILVFFSWDGYITVGGGDADDEQGRSAQWGTAGADGKRKVIVEESFRNPQVSIEMLNVKRFW